MNDILDRVGRLTALPTTVLRVGSMIAGGESTVAALEKVIRQDEALSMAVLRYANSARYGRPGRTFVLREGIARLGTELLKKIVLEHQAAGVFADAGGAYGLQRGALWRGAVGGAHAAEGLARRAASVNADLAFIAALLRDVGKLAFDAAHGEQHARRIAEAMTPDRSCLDAERAVYGFDHAELGAALATRWSLPERIAEAIAFHHAPPEDPRRQNALFDIVHAADMVALWAGLGVGVDGLHYRLADHVRTRLNLDRPTVELAMADAFAGVREVEASAQHAPGAPA
ncbi:MAG: HDOD domain-containing protein [Planctomycetota bacterium]|nr:HDOD domain-containing protein [Planctomycetota bacterium]